MAGGTLFAQEKARHAISHDVIGENKAHVYAVPNTAVLAQVAIAFKAESVVERSARDSCDALSSGIMSR